MELLISKFAHNEKIYIMHRYLVMMTIRSLHIFSYLSKLEVKFQASFQLGNKLY